MKDTLVFIFLLVLGLAQLTGDTFNIPTLKALGAATGVSPAPKVFTAHEGFETYSSRFYVQWREPSGKQNSLQLTPEIYRGIKGPYNRRNAYGAALSYFPVLYSNQHTRPMFESAVSYAFCDTAPMLSELNIDPDNIVGDLSIRLEPRQVLPKNHKWKLNYQVKCNG